MTLEKWLVITQNNGSLTHCLRSWKLEVLALVTLIAAAPWFGNLPGLPMDPLSAAFVGDPGEILLCIANIDFT